MRGLIILVLLLIVVVAVVMILRPSGPRVTTIEHRRDERDDERKDCD